MAAEQYIYQAMSVHLRERDMLNQKDLERLIATGDVHGVYAVLNEKGWNMADYSAADSGGMLADQETKTWELAESLIGGLSALDVLRRANDFHNLKAAIKLVHSDGQADFGRYFIKGVMDANDILAAAKQHDFSDLPPDMAEAGKEAYKALAHTGNGQYCDMIVDRAALAAIDRAGRETKSELLKEYARITVDGANIKAAVRCCNMGKQRVFIERAIAPAGTLDPEELINAAAESIDSIYAYLSDTAYANAVPALRQSIAAFERWCDNRILNATRPQRNNYETTDPVAAYIIARLAEIRMVKLILSAKINGLDTGLIRERLRETYV